ncbi:hypothetical protein GALMADRAFT_248144 [Galerina marginata CBS 339.88]|uniref:F-box domain-containing protein n=1 Tax=Galerina marginata (strain CBS 339.88) TaxID=685588 RepID=A0A067SXF3_GALM3|nr:hypothetical protein GALMADRAFT_248144 [Galerina marginata CBS 339.88]
MTLRCDAFDQQVGLTNEPLTALETKQIRERLYTRRNQILGTDNSLKHRQGGNHAELSEDRDQILALINRYEIALAPHKQLPTELLQRVFHHVCEGYDQGSPRIQDPPLLLCRISSYWRTTAINMPELWKSLHMSTDMSHTRTQKLKLARMWFARAGNLPLSLTLSDTQNDFSGPVDFVSRLIAPFSRNFRYLYLVLQHPQVAALFSLPTGSLDALEEFHVVYYLITTAVPPPPWQAPITLFSPAARLRRLRIHLTPLVVPRIFTLPWHRLESFRCDSSIQSEDCHELFVSCQTLQKIHVRIFGIKYSSPSQVEISLLNLISLSVQLCDQENYDLFFLPLVAPSLRSLLIFNYHGLPWSPGMYSGLLERSRCELVDIYLGTMDMEAGDVLRFFESTPAIESITLSHNTFIPPVIYHKIGQGEVGRSLVQFFLKGTRELDPLLSMLETRLQNFPMITSEHGMQITTSPLKFIETYSVPEEVTAHDSRIQQLRNTGVGISLLQSAEGYFHL